MDTHPNKIYKDIAVVVATPCIMVYAPLNRLIYVFIIKHDTFNLFYLLSVCDTTFILFIIIY